MEWDNKVKETFDKIINELPQFHRSIAQRLVKESAEEIARQRGASIVEEKDLVEAFFKEVPPAFKGMMERLFSKLKIDCSSYIDE
jgi:hypothetical protein